MAAECDVLVGHRRIPNFVRCWLGACSISCRLRSPFDPGRCCSSRHDVARGSQTPASTPLCIRGGRRGCLWRGNQHGTCNDWVAHHFKASLEMRTRELCSYTSPVPIGSAL